MKNLIKISAILLFAASLHSPLLAQKKLALANECFNAKAYYLASRYYQQAFGKTSDCHPDQIKLAKSLAATQQLIAAENVFESYLMNCDKNNPKANIAYGKFLMDIQAYEKAIPYFERSMDAEPQLARHYVLACRTALPKAAGNANPIFVKQPATNTVVSQNETTKMEPSMPSFTSILEEETTSEIDETSLSASASSIDLKPNTSVAANGINLYDAMVPEKQTNTTSHKEPRSKAYQASEKVMVKERIPVVVEKKTSPFGVRLGTYQPSKVPSLSAVKNYGKIEQKQWNGKTIVFLVDFSSRAAAEAALKVARSKKFRGATLVEKLPSGRMKSVR